MKARRLKVPGKSEPSIADLEREVRILRDERLKAAKERSTPSPASVVVTEWFERERTLGYLSPEGIRVLERLLEDIR